MNRSTRRRIKKIPETEVFAIKASALREFIEYAYAQNFRARLRIAGRILFKRVKFGK